MLRGPQGTLYGRNTIGGAVKFISSPLTNDLSGKLEATYGNYDRFDIKGFHDAVLRQGSVPLPVLERQIKAWIEERKKA